jgi:hypothetical protein
MSHDLKEINENGAGFQGILKKIYLISEQTCEEKMCSLYEHNKDFTIHKPLERNENFHAQIKSGQEGIEKLQ